MTVERLNKEEISGRAVALLGLDCDAVDLFSDEGLCASLRRAASLMCPATPRQLVDSVIDALAPLDPAIDRSIVNEALDRLISVGDLLELRTSDGTARLLFLAPPSYVETRPGNFLLIGIRPNGSPILDEPHAARIEFESHTRSIFVDPLTADDLFATAGVHRVTREQWTRSPRFDSAATVVARAEYRLKMSPSTGSIPGLSVIDSTSSVRYYKGRWRDLTGDDEGMYVGRRPQAFGAPIWCLIQVSRGVPTTLADLPFESSVFPGWDEARLIQAAIDSQRGHPQTYRTRPAAGNIMFDFFAPLPSWAERFVTLNAVPVNKSTGALFSYRVPVDAEPSLTTFLSDSMWMTSTTEAWTQ